jgi:diguanylate cyclase (GGDEF)-like protein
MAIPDALGLIGSGRTRSLRREWSRAFAVMLALLLVAAAATIIGLRAVVGQVQGTARRLHVESVTVAALSTALVAHEQVGHKLLSAEPVDRVAYVRKQHELAGLFDRAVTIFPTTNGMKATLVTARHSWQVGLTTYGLWDYQVQSLHGDHSADNPKYGAASDATASMLAGLEGPSLDAMDRGLAHGTDLEHILMAMLAALFALAVAVTVYFRRRMVTDLIRPVASMHQGVLKLRAGEYTYRLRVARRDELGELSEAFNGMAGALHESHLALTLRATHDSLTGLPNRASLTERLAASFRPGSERRRSREGVLFIDVDDFKDVNDTLGHEGGDVLLMQLATRLTSCVRPSDMVARLGGDEFAIVVVEDDGDFSAAQVAARIIAAMSKPFFVNGTSLAVSVSIGVAPRQPDTADPAELLRFADFAMYMAKGNGKDGYQLYDAEVHDDVVVRSNVKTDLATVATAAPPLA